MTLPKGRRIVIALIFSVYAFSVYASAAVFENTAIIRSAELGGSIVHVTTTYAVKALKGGQTTYRIALGAEDKAKTSWMEGKIKGQKEQLKLKEHAIVSNKGYHLVDVVLPRPSEVNKTMNIVLETIQTHATWPCPATAAQNEEQALKYKTDLFVLSPYHTVVQRTKLKTLTPRIVSHTTPQNGDVFASKDSVTKSGATLTYGPYDNIPPSTNREFIDKYQQPVVVHYNHEQPVVEVLSLQRSVEISHWGANMNTEDKILLHNAGPKLKGHFSRLEYQSQKYFNRIPSHVLPSLNLLLPAGIQNAYFYDLIGNVSTSSLRTSPSVSKDKQGSAFSVLDLRPRYPLLGGWNYSFTVGWDAPLRDSTSYDAKTGKFIVEVPIMTPIPGAVINEEELGIILPEGADDVEFLAPFPAVSNWTGTHITYLDSVGRPKLTFTYKDLTLKHMDYIIVSYRLPWNAHLRKPIAVGIAFLTFFIFGMIARRVNLTLHHRKTS